MQENPAFLTEQIITYLGNKRALLDFIGQAVLHVKRRYLQSGYIKGLYLKMNQSLFELRLSQLTYRVVKFHSLLFYYQLY